MNNDAPCIEFDEEVDFILAECKKQGFSISKDTIEIILDLDMKFLESKGIAIPSEEE
ncbi:MAG: hypothetical protein RSD47_08965 [Romboutsia sp.]